MKNKIIIDIDSEREQQIKLSKDETSVPSNWEEAQEMINMDITCLVETTIHLIEIGDKNEYFDRQTVYQNIIKKFTQAFIKVDEPTKDDTN